MALEGNPLIPRQESPLTLRGHRHRFTSANARTRRRQGRQKSHQPLLQIINDRPREGTAVRLSYDPRAKGETDSVDIDRLAAHAALLSLLAQLETYYSKAIKLQSVTEREVQTYKNEVDQIRQSIPALPPTYFPRKAPCDPVSAETDAIQRSDLATKYSRNGTAASGEARRRSASEGEQDRIREDRQADRSTPSTRTRRNVRCSFCVPSI